MENDELHDNEACIKIEPVIISIKFEDFDFDYILLNEKSHKNISICDISCKSLIAQKYLYIRFDKTDGFIRIYDGTRYLVLFGPGKYDAVYKKL